MAKVNQNFKTVAVEVGKVYFGMPDEMKTALNGLTIEDAIKSGLITDLGDDDGNLLDGDDNGDFAVINGRSVTIGKSIKKLEEELTEEEFSRIAAKFRFNYAESTVAGDGKGKMYFRLQYNTGGRKSTNARGNVFLDQDEKATVGQA